MSRPPAPNPPDQPRRRTIVTRSTLRASLLLRVHEERVEHVHLRYEVVDLARGGESRSFASLPALQRWLRARGEEETGSATTPASA